MKYSNSELRRLLNHVITSKKDTELAKTLKEIESNRDYIDNVQLPKLLKLHDHSFKAKCVDPMFDLYEKHCPILEHDANIQNRTALVDRDLRVIEMTLALIKSGKETKKQP
ncbi:Bls1p KNAG_0B06240 [Huiozyma naganishii CBS 8797]|uniref:Uncharacterized protein n=1 Tax=Huiozyma naganishii (strain ATCC MYA-139 / BCRC 22969 / CBS 8797 / KCTC 17520 / NBRC 10181 / NCYC 3082 / Yp74L-3) TaxID=1071383 RepID=J7S434_HUIN7|nr:hypothetical protein KNAG_0B06240 [Kazachstania naganishii CBS 8797]CCK69054.1 hypothetical protein KNAG_0B06240 [Kazachstania naganishii CBS 8797]